MLKRVNSQGCGLRALVRGKKTEFQRSTLNPQRATQAVAIHLRWVKTVCHSLLAILHSPAVNRFLTFPLWHCGWLCAKNELRKLQAQATNS